ncbi:HAD family hydrolase [Uliginosibacterium sp. H1]|uniref:histidinol-phosphatase n=1 Tax=Uliginosibacterium sp. H1 TaxID=3114757 RepID=UPI002E19345A|nr:HAD family hydrolase [Uliginosibacterium sp. H1]
MNLALFDLDNTLLAGDSDHAWGEFLANTGVVDGVEYRRRNDAYYEQYKAGTLDVIEFQCFVMEPLARLSRAELDGLHTRFMAECIAPMMLPQARALVRKHLDAGDLCAVVTATNAFVVAPIVRQLGIPHLIATIPAQENGRFTGQPRGIPAFQKGKIARVEAWLESLALNWQSFAQSHFYSDSLNDLPLLECVTHPVAVDPDPTLRAKATERGWPVVSLRA